MIVGRIHRYLNLVRQVSHFDSVSQTPFKLINNPISEEDNKLLPISIEFLNCSRLCLLWLNPVQVVGYKALYFV